MQHTQQGFLAQHRVLISICVAIPLIIALGLSGTLPLWLRWIGILLIMCAVLVVAGYDKTEREVTAANGRVHKIARYDGVFIDDRNIMSLSRFQIILWTLMALSSWSALVLHRTIPVLLNSVAQLESGKAPALTNSMQALLKRNGVTLESAQVEALYKLLTGDDSVPQSALPNYEPLNVSFPNELLLAMGISTTSLALSAIIKTNKAHTETGATLERQQTEKDAAQKTLTEANAKLDALNQDFAQATADKEAATDPDLKKNFESKLQSITKDTALAKAAVDAAQKKYDELEKTDNERMGLLHANENVQDARWSDMLSGERVQDYQYIDISKVQMFFFTVIIVFSYAALIWAQMNSAGAQTLFGVLPQVSLPGFSQSLVALLGLSHAGYLTVKTAAQ